MGNVNLVTNPSFESGTAGWSAVNASLATDTFPNAIAGSGSNSGKFTASGGAKMAAQYTVSGLTAGKNYTLSYYVKTSAAFAVAASANGVFANAAATTALTFQRRQYGFKATGTTATVVISSLQNNASGDVMWLDNVLVKQGGPGPYFDGTYPYCSWTGTAGASTSTCSVLDASTDSVTTDEIVVVNGLCLNTLAYNGMTKTGRYTLPVVRGDDLTIPGATGRLFTANKPIDSGLWTLSMFVAGCNPDGTVPTGTAQRAMFEYNLNRILQACASTSTLVDVYAWQADGSVRTTKTQLFGTSAIDPTLFMGGRRAEISFAFETINGVWSDYITHSVVGVAGAGWSNQTLSMPALAGGTAAIEDSVITVAGPITNPRVTNSITGTWIQYTGTVASGSSWVVDCKALTSKVGGSSVIANTTHGGGIKFMIIDPGNISTSPALTLTGSGTSGSTNLSVVAARKHLVA